MNVKRMLLLVGLLCVVGAGGGAWWFYEHEAEGDPNQLTLYGNVDIREVKLAFEVQGRVARIDVEEGDSIQQDQLLATLEPSRFQHDLDRAEAGVEAQRQVLAELEAGTRQEEIRQARAEVKAAEARLLEATRNHERFTTLQPSGAVSDQRVDDAKAAKDTARAQLRVAQAALDLANAGPRQQTVAAARARLKKFQAEAALMQWALDETQLRTTNSGVVRQRILEPGDMAAPERPIFTVALTDPVWIRAYLNEPDLGKVKPGINATVTTDSYPDQPYQGWVGFIAPTAEFTPKSVHTEDLRTKLVYEVRIYVDNPRNQLRLGMPVTVTIPLETTTATPRRAD